MAGSLLRLVLFVNNVPFFPFSEAVGRYGFIKGWVMSMDRLMRCGRDEVRLAPKIWVNEEWKVFDPVETNDWLKYMIQIY